MSIIFENIQFLNEKIINIDLLEESEILQE